MKTYKIMGKTNGYIASRDGLFKGKELITLGEGMELRSAQRTLLSYFNWDYDTAFRNWGLVRCNRPDVSWSHADGTRGYEYDSRRYYIEEETEE